MFNVQLFLIMRNWFAAMGTGRSKKEAKHTAAKAILDKLIGANENSDASIINSIIEWVIITKQIFKIFLNLKFLLLEIKIC